MWKSTKEKISLKKGEQGIGIVCGIGLAFILLGLLLLIVPQIELVSIAYVMSVIFVVSGIIWIVQYFLTEAYRNINRYGFSAGSLLVILGMCALVKAEEIAGYFLLCMGILILVMGVVKLQNALDLKALEEPAWKVVLALALAVIVCAVVILLNPFEKRADLEWFTYMVLVVDGVFSIISTICLGISLRKYQKKQAGIEEKQEEKEDEQ